MAKKTKKSFMDKAQAQITRAAKAAATNAAVAAADAVIQAVVRALETRGTSSGKRKKAVKRKKPAVRRKKRT